MRPRITAITTISKYFPLKFAAYPDHPAEYLYLISLEIVHRIVSGVVTDDAPQPANRINPQTLHSERFIVLKHINTILPCGAHCHIHPLALLHAMLIANGPPS